MQDLVIGKNLYPKFNDVVGGTPLLINGNGNRVALIICAYSAGAVEIRSGNAISAPIFAYVYGPILGSGAIGQVTQVLGIWEYGSLITGPLAIQSTNGTHSITEMLATEPLGLAWADEMKKMGQLANRNY